MTKLYLLIFTSILLFIKPTSAQPKYEFRGIWVATVNNIDWPSNKYLDADSQKKEFLQLLDLHQRNGMNAIIAQIRPASDAFYPSQYEPWSEWLTGVQGKPPLPYYDPLEFMLHETHKRGMEFHAWINPYRAESNIGRSSISPLHITKLHPEWFLVYGGKRYFDPGNKEAQQFVNNIVRDVVKRYDIDAIHFDDYFYPYRIAGSDFPDNASYKKYGNGLNKNDWRRSNVDSIIYMLSKTIKQENKFCKFGISPFGVWRNSDKDAEGSDTRRGLTSYDDLYADILLWLKLKWIDYVSPQLYWQYKHKMFGFDKLTDWWTRHAYGRHLYIGHGIYNAFERNMPAWKNKRELPLQINKLREYKEVQGSIYYSSKTFNKNPNGWNDSLQNNYYKYPALIPPVPWIDSLKPAPPVIAFDSLNQSTGIDFIRIFIQPNPFSSPVNKYVVYSFAELSEMNINEAKNIVAITSSIKKYFVFPLSEISSSQNKIIIAVTAINKAGMESSPSRYIFLERNQDTWLIKNLKDNN